MDNMMLVPTWAQIREVANEVDQMAVQSVQRACDLGDMLRAVRLTMDGESFIRSIGENLQRGHDWAFRMITLSFRRHAAMTCDNPTAAYEEVKRLPAPKEETVERKQWPKAPRGPQKGSGGRPKGSTSRAAPKVSTVNVYYEIGLIPEPKSGGQTQRINKEVDAIDPGARESGDAARVRAAAMKVAAARKPDAVVEVTSGRAEADRAELAPSAQQKLDAAIRSATRALEAKFEVRIREAVDAELADILPAYHRDHEKAKATLLAYKGVLTRSEYKKVLSALHSDRITDEADKRRHDEAFNIIKQHEELLCGFDEEKLGGTIPKTITELMARRAASQGRR